MKVKIAITGPESCGKSTLCKALASHFNTNYSYEYARKYLEENLTETNEKLIHMFIREQLSLEKELLKSANKYLFCDTDLTNFKIWLEHDGFEIPSFLEQEIKNKNYALILLLQPDIPWVADKLRLYPDKRDYFFHKFEAELILEGLEYIVIGGEGVTRVNNAISAINNFFSNK